MTNTSLSPPLVGAPSPPDARWAAVLLVVQHTCMLVALAVLAISIGWPASLSLPIADQLAALRLHPSSVELGYTTYLVSSLALGGAALALRRALNAGRPHDGFLHDVLATAGVAAAFAKLLGIVRWLDAMPMLAHQPGAVSAAGAIDAYAGSVGELLGVGVLSSIFYVALAFALGRSRLPARRWLVGACVLTGVLGLPWSLVIHGDLAPLLTIGGAIATVTGFAVAVTLLRTSRGSVA